MLCVISNEYRPRPGGAGIIADIFCKDMSAQIISPLYSNTLTFKYGFRIAKYFWIIELTVRAFFVSKKASLLINDFGGLISIFLASFGRLHKFNTIFFLHHGLQSEGNGKFQNFKTIILYKILSAETITNIFVSNYIREEIHRESGLWGEAFYFPLLEYRGVASTDKTSTKNFLRQKLNLSRGLKLVIATRITKEKFPLESIDFLEGLSSILGKIQVNVYGSGNNAYMNRIEKRVDLSKHPINLEFVGLAKRERVIDAMRLSTGVFNPSKLREALPTVGLEAALTLGVYIHYKGYGHHEANSFNSAPVFSADSWTFNEGVRLADLLLKWEKSDINIKSLNPSHEISRLKAYFQ